MAQFVMSYPFQIDTNNNRMGVVLQDNDSYKAQQIQAFLRTHKGERAIFDSFGIDEPTFDAFSTAEFYDAFGDFYDESTLNIEEIEVSETNGVLTDIKVAFS